MKKIFLCIGISLCCMSKLFAQGDSLIIELKNTIQLYMDSVGVEDLTIGMYYDSLAVLYLDERMISEADSMFSKALETKFKYLDENHLDIADSYHNLGRVQLYFGKFDLAYILFEKGIKIRLDTLGETHPDVADSYYRLGIADWKMGEYEKARNYFSNALKIRLAKFGENHLDVAESYNSLGIINWETGDYEKSDIYYHKALKIRFTLDTTKLLIAESYNSLGTLNATRGYFEKAIHFYDKSFKIKIEKLDEGDIRRAYHYHNLGVLYKDIGDYEKAIELCNKALAIKLKKLEDNHLDNTSTYDVLGLIYLETEDYQKALYNFNKSLNIKLDVGEGNHADIAFNYNSLGIIYREQGDTQKAINFFNKALNISKSVFGEKHSIIADSYYNLAITHKVLGNSHRAIGLFEKALHINLEILGENHPNISNHYVEIASIYDDIKDYEAADSLWQILIPQSLRRLKSTYLFLANQERVNYLNTFNSINSTFYTFATNYYSEKTTQLATNYLLNTKSLALDYGISTNQLIKEINDSTLIRQYHQLNKLNKDIADVEILTFEERLESGLDLSELQNQNYILASKILKHPQLKDKLDTKTITWRDIQSKLTSEEASIDFLRVYDTHNNVWTYYGIIIRKDSANPQFVRLCDEKTLESILNNGETSESVLFKNIWQSFTPYLNDIHTIHLSRTGLLHRIAFEALLNEQDQNLITKYTFHYYTALRDMIKRKQEETRLRDILLMGDILYDLDNRDPLNVQENPLFKGALRRGVSPLPETLKEVTEIKRTATAAGLSSTMLTIDAASEDTIQHFVGEHAPSIIHYATHAVFLLPLGKKKESANLINSRKRLLAADNPLLRSALLLYGANETWTKGNRIFGSKEDGILTALEVTALDLQNTDLVVLSACSTGLGDSHNTEGIFGLQRAFKLAGVEHTIVSLWDVDDVATKDLMILFYQNLLEKKQSIANALRNAKLVMKQKGAKAKNWAGFILIE